MVSVLEAFSMTVDLSGKVAVVTGAARGIGRTLVGGFVQSGVRVVATDLVTGDTSPFSDPVTDHLVPGPSLRGHPAPSGVG